MSTFILSADTRNEYGKLFDFICKTLARYGKMKQAGMYIRFTVTRTGNMVKITSNFSDKTVYFYFKDNLLYYSGPIHLFGMERNVTVALTPETEKDFIKDVICNWYNEGLDYFPRKIS